MPANAKFCEWLQELVDQQAHNQNMQMCYRRALSSLRKVDHALNIDALQQVKFVGPSVVNRLREKMNAFLNAGGSVETMYDPPTCNPAIVLPSADATVSTAPKKTRKPRATTAKTSSNTENAEAVYINNSHSNVLHHVVNQDPIAVRQSAADIVAHIVANSPAKKQRTTASRPYEPKYRSGAYALLMALYKHTVLPGSSASFMTKAQLMDEAQPFCDTSMRDPQPGKSQFYTAFNSMSSLKEKELVRADGNPVKYYLTGDGMDLAEKLWQKSVALGVVEPAPSTGLSTQSDSLLVARQSSRPAAIPVQKPVAPVIPQIASSTENFQFWYLNKENRTEKLKDYAEIRIESHLCYVKIQYHQSQSVHPFCNKILKANMFPDATGMLTGYILDQDAPNESPGIDYASIFARKEASMPREPTSNQLPILNQTNFNEKTATINLTNSRSTSQKAALPPKPPSKSSSKTTSSSQLNLAESSTVTSRSETRSTTLIITDERSDFIRKLPTFDSSNCPVAIWPPSDPTPQPIDFDFSGLQPTRIPHDAYDIFIVVDNREIRSRQDRFFLPNELERRNIACFQRSLSLGDVMWVARTRPNSPINMEVVLDSIVERKKLDDLVSSIKDGRFREQKLRLKLCGLKHVFYLVEDSVEGQRQMEEFGRDKIRSALTLTPIQDDIFVKRTGNMDETVEFLALLTQKIKAMYQGKDLYVVPSFVEKENYRSMKTALESHFGEPFHFAFSDFDTLNDKSKTLTLKNVWFKQLLAIRGVSPEKAQTIVSAYPTPHSLISALKSKQTDAERVALLKALNGPVTRKNLGPTLCAKIVELFCAEVYTN